MKAYITENETLFIELDTKNGNYTSMTQHSKGETTLAINGLTRPEIAEIRRALDELEKSIPSEVETPG